MSLIKKSILAVLVSLFAVSAQTTMKDYTFRDVSGESHHFYGYLDNEQYLALFITKPGN